MTSLKWNCFHNLELLPFLLEHHLANSGLRSQLEASGHIWRSWGGHFSAASSHLYAHGREEDDVGLLRYPTEGKSCYPRTMAQRHPNVSARSQPGSPSFSSWQVTHIWGYLSPDKEGWQLFLPQGPWPRSGEVAEHPQTGCIKRKVSVDKSKW